MEGTQSLPVVALPTLNKEPMSPPKIQSTKSGEFAVSTAPPRPSTSLFVSAVASNSAVSSAQLRSQQDAVRTVLLCHAERLGFVPGSPQHKALIAVLNGRTLVPSSTHALVCASVLGNFGYNVLRELLLCRALARMPSVAACLTAQLATPVPPRERTMLAKEFLANEPLVLSPLSEEIVAPAVRIVEDVYITSGVVHPTSGHRSLKIETKYPVTGPWRAADAQADYPGVMLFGAAARAHNARKIASYRIRELARPSSSKKERRDYVAVARKAKSDKFDRLTGVVPQVGFNFVHGITPEVQSLMSSLVVNFREALDSVSGTVDNVNANLGTAVDLVKGVVEDSSVLFDKVASGALKFMWTIPLIAAAFYAVTSVDKFKNKASLLCVSSVLALLLPIGLWDSIKDLWPNETFYDCPEVDFQAGILEPATLAHIISVCMTFLTFGKDDRLGTAEKFVKAVAPYGRTVDSWSKLSGFILSTVEKFVNFIRSMFGADKIALYQTGVKQVDTWCTKVMHVVNSSHTGGDVMTPDSVANIVALHREGTDLANMYRFSSDVTVMLHKYLGYLSELTKLCAAAVHSFKGGRPQPVVLGFTGDPGVGKTFLCKYVISHILSNVISKERAEELNYNFDCEMFQKGDGEYWNGYAGQKAVIIDDWGQSVPSPGTDNDFINLIRMANCWSYPLNFADLENKGKNFFRSDLIMLTTNISNLNSAEKVIVEPAAVTRRIDFGFKILVSEEFSLNGKIDIGKVTSYISETKEFPYHAWKLYKHKFAVGSGAVTDMTQEHGLRDVLDQVAAVMQRNKDVHSHNTEFIQQMLRTKYESQAGDFEFFDCVTDPAYAAYKSVTAKMATLSVDIHTGLNNFMSLLFKHKGSPFIMFLMGTAGFLLLKTVLTSAVSAVISWFSPKKDEDKVSDAAVRLRRSPVLQQAVSALQTSDFEEIVVVEGKATIIKRFTPEVLLRAYNRLIGTAAQSNIPEAMRLKHRIVSGQRVYESDIPIDPQADHYGNDIANIAAESLYTFDITGTKGRLTLGHVLMVRDTCGLVPLHFDAHIRKNLEKGNFDLSALATLRSSCNPDFTVSYTVKQFLDLPRHIFPDDDGMFVRFTNIRAHRDLGNFFVLNSDLTNLSKVRVRLETADTTGKVATRRSRAMFSTRSDKIVIGEPGASYTLAIGYEYVGFTEYGDCGGLVCVEETPFLASRRILGVHVAGAPSLKLGFCNVITQDKVNIATQALGLLRDTQFQSNVSSLVAAAPVAGSFLGLHKACAAKHSSPTSSLRRTPLFGAWGSHPKRPMPLGPFVNVDGVRIKPMEQALKPYTTPVITYDEAEVQRACFHAFSRVTELTKDVQRRIYSFDEAVVGIPGEFKGMPRGTSPGYPYVFEGHTNKKKFFGKDADYDLTSVECETLRKVVAQVESDAKLGIRSEHIFMDFLKDELRSEKKIEKGLARLISSAPLAYSIIFRQYFLSFTVAVQNTRIRNGVAVGINPYTEWDVLAKRLQSKGDKCVAGDFTGFDSSEQPQVHMAILDNINAWYDDGPTNALVRKVLWMEVVHSRHCGGVNGTADTIYQWNKSLPSGHPATSIINSFYNLTVFLMVWIDIMGPTKGPDFWDSVYICVYGDDNILNVSDEVAPRFNQVTIERSMAKYGMTYTTETKESGVAPTRPLSAVGFLKRGFKFEPLVNRFVGPQELDSILYIPYWSRNAAQLTEVTLTNMELTFAELSLHGDDVWNSLAYDMKAKFVSIMEAQPKQYFTREQYVTYCMSMELPWL